MFMQMGFRFSKINLCGFFAISLFPTPVNGGSYVYVYDLDLMTLFNKRYVFGSIHEDVWNLFKNNQKLV